MITLAAQPLVESLKTRLKARVAATKAAIGRPPHLSVILVGDDPASEIYVTQKGKMALELGMTHETLHFPASTPLARFRETLKRLNDDPEVDGILVQRPTPIQGLTDEESSYLVDPGKDVDAFHPENLGRLVLGLPCLQPCTPAGVMALLKHYGISVAGKTACVVGRSSIVGKPMAALLLQHDATVLQAHSKTPDLAAITRQADLVIAATGRAKLITGTHLKPGAVVIDVGISRDASGKLSGDVDFASAAEVASAISPVPGGVGRMTIMMLMENTVSAARRRLPHSP